MGRSHSKRWAAEKRKRAERRRAVEVARAERLSAQREANKRVAWI
jgi:hypothetical protein